MQNAYTHSQLLKEFTKKQQTLTQQCDNVYTKKGKKIQTLEQKSYRNQKQHKLMIQLQETQQHLMIKFTEEHQKIKEQFHEATNASKNYIKN